MKKLEVEVRIEEIKCIKVSREEKGGMFIISLTNKEDKRIVMRRKGKLKGNNIWIDDGLT